MNKQITTDSPEAFMEELEKLQNALPSRIEANPEKCGKGSGQISSYPRLN